MIKKELEAIASISHGAQRDYYLSLARDLKSVEVVSITEAFSEEECERIRKHLKPRIKQCYRNAFLLAQMFPDCVEYVEGRMSIPCIGNCFSIEHAFNKVGNKYVDVTMELVLKNIDNPEYVSLIECTYGEVANVIAKTGMYGGVYNYVYNKTKQNI